MTLTEPMKKMLALFAADITAWNCLHGFRNASRTVDALIERGLVRFVPINNDPTVGEMEITMLGRAIAFRLLTGIVVWHDDEISAG